MLSEGRQGLLLMKAMGYAVETVFLWLLNRAWTAGWLIAGVLILRLLLPRMPGWVKGVLWGMVALRLVLPFSLESVWSLIPSAEVVSPHIVYTMTPGYEIHTGISALNHVVQPAVDGVLAPAEIGASVYPAGILLAVLSYIWCAGVLLLLVRAVFSAVRLYRSLGQTEEQEARIRRGYRVPTPFVLGILRPSIYLPATLDEEASRYVVAHERAHIARGDTLWKLIGYLLLCVYWFQPLVWVGYICFCRDMELACDARVIGSLETSDEKKAYARALLLCGAGAQSNRRISACPVAFGEVGVKKRIRAVLSYKKPGLWIVILACVLAAVLAVCFLTDPYKLKETSLWSKDTPGLYMGGRFVGQSMALSSLGADDNGRYMAKITIWGDGMEIMNREGRVTFQADRVERHKDTSEGFYGTLPFFLPASETPLWSSTASFPLYDPTDTVASETPLWSSIATLIPYDPTDTAAPDDAPVDTAAQNEGAGEAVEIYSFYGTGYGGVGSYDAEYSVICIDGVPSMIGQGAYGAIIRLWTLVPYVEGGTYEEQSEVDHIKVADAGLFNCSLRLSRPLTEEERSGIYFGSNNAEKMAISAVHHLPTYHFTTHDALWDFVSAYEGTGAESLAVTFGPEWFEQRDLILCFSETANKEDFMVIDTILATSAHLTIKTTLRKSIGDPAPQSAEWFHCLGLPKELCENVELFTVTVEN